MRRFCALWVVAFPLVGCSSDAVTGGSNPVGPYITYALPNGAIYRVEAKEGAAAQNVSTALSKLSPGVDGWINASPDGEWLVLASERFNTECSGYWCLTLVNRALTDAEVIVVSGAAIHPGNFGAVANGGNLIVYEGESGGGTHLTMSGR